MQNSDKLRMNNEQKRVALCVTCLVDELMPEVGVAAVRLLRRAGYEVAFPSEQTCCGQPFFNSGFRDEAIRLAQRTIEIFEHYHRVVLPSGSCTTMIRIEYAHLLEDLPKWHERARQLAAKTFELSEFLVRQARWKPARIEQAPNVTYHDSCHMCRLLHLKEEPRQLLDDAGFQLTEMAETDRCCGFGGTFSIRMPGVSNAITAEKLYHAAETDVPLLVTADPGCLMQMRDLLEDGRKQQVEHLAVVLEETLR
jgi:L-lactate dehydrogenase complex protein LldE